jgi:hypothetical protein
VAMMGQQVNAATEMMKMNLQMFFCLLPRNEALLKTLLA